MATLFSSSPSTSYMNDLISNFSTNLFDTIDESYLIRPDTFSLDPSDLFSDYTFPTIPSICGDIQKLQYGDSAMIDLSSSYEMEDEQKCIRNMNCMWSSPPQDIATPKANTNFSATATNALSTSATSNFSDSSVTVAVPFAQVTSSSNVHNTYHMNAVAPTVIVAKSPKKDFIKQEPLHSDYGQLLTPQQQTNLDLPFKIKTEIKQESSNDDYEKQLQQHSIPNSRTGAQQQQQQSMQHIPPGTSLLRKSNTQRRMQQQHQKIIGGNNKNVIKMTQVQTKGYKQNITNNDKNNSNSNNNACYTRPDTPTSLDNDEDNNNNNNANHNGSVLKHNIDLRACVMGSNNISLPTDASNYIKNVSRELQNTNKEKIDARYLPHSCASFTEAFKVLGSPSTDGIDYDDEDEDDNDTTNAVPADDDYVMSDSVYYDDNIVTAMLDETELSALLPQKQKQQLHLKQKQQHNMNQQQLQHQFLMHSDHSYTRCKEVLDGLDNHLDTPSDSDEEIDVVSIGDKKLPTNPSDKDRFALQSNIASKFSDARIVRTAKGLRTLPPRRRGSYEMPYTPASNSPVKSVANSRYPSPASTPYQYTTKYVKQQQPFVVLADGTTTPINLVQGKSRKRPSGLTSNDSTAVVNGIEYALPSASKKPRVKKASSSARNSCTVTTVGMSSGASGSVLQRQYSTDEAADTIEKRNLHNDMERQRRIGLKNLFEMLKREIPSIRDKERAPKVNILREAAKLCEALVIDDEELMLQKEILMEQIRKHEELLALLQAEQCD